MKGEAAPGSLSRRGPNGERPTGQPPEGTPPGFSEGVPGYGVSRSRISERLGGMTFGRYAQQQLEKRLVKRLEAFRFVALMVDGVKLGEHAVIVALGIDMEGHKRLVGLREGATENGMFHASLTRIVNWIAGFY